MWIISWICARSNFIFKCLGNYLDFYLDFIRFFLFNWIDLFCLIFWCFFFFKSSPMKTFLLLLLLFIFSSLAKLSLSLFHRNSHKFKWCNAHFTQKTNKLIYRFERTRTNKTKKKYIYITATSIFSYFCPIYFRSGCCPFNAAALAIWTKCVTRYIVLNPYTRSITQPFWLKSRIRLTTHGSFTLRLCMEF